MFIVQYVMVSGFLTYRNLCQANLAQQKKTDHWLYIFLHQDQSVFTGFDKLIRLLRINGKYLYCSGIFYSCQMSSLLLTANTDTNFPLPYNSNFKIKLYAHP